MDRNLGLELVRVTEAAALASARLMGRGDEKAADQAAVDAMRRAFDDIDIDGMIVIGEGERDEAPMLYIGENVGTKKGPSIDIALDPLEGTTITAKGGYNATSVIAVAERGCFLHAPDTYMNKIAVGPEARGLVNLDDPIPETLKKVAQAMKKHLEDLTVCILDRPRHDELIKQVRDCGSRIKLISDGDVSGAIATCMPDSPVDILLGIGGAPEGVLSAAALKCLAEIFRAVCIFETTTKKNELKKWESKTSIKHIPLKSLPRANRYYFAPRELPTEKC